MEKPLLKLGDELEVVGTKIKVVVTKATSAFAHLSDNAKVRQVANGRYEEMSPDKYLSAKVYKLITPEYAAEKARIAAEKRAQKEQRQAEKTKQIIEKIITDGVPAHAIDIIHVALFHDTNNAILRYNLEKKI